MQRRRSGREFKIEAVRLIRDRGVSVAQASRDLDVHENMPRKWVKEFAADPAQAFPGQGQMTGDGSGCLTVDQAMLEREELLRGGAASNVILNEYRTYLQHRSARIAAFRSLLDALAGKLEEKFVL